MSAASAVTKASRGKSAPMALMREMDVGSVIHLRTGESEAQGKMRGSDRSQCADDGGRYKGDGCRSVIHPRTESSGRGKGRREAQTDSGVLTVAGGMRDMDVSSVIHLQTRWS